MNFNYNIPLKLNIPNLSFRSNSTTFVPSKTYVQDGFCTDPLYDDFGTKSHIESEAKSNPRIMELMKKYNLPIKANIDELEKLKRGHLKDTRVVAAQIYSNLPHEMKQEINLPHLQEAAMFHDYGKVLIPNSVLNKSGKLDEKEHEIMQLHSELGFELLKNKGLSKETLNLIKYHHQNYNGDGYPLIVNDYEYSLASEILMVSDKYTALREKRCYKDSMSHDEALEIIKQDVEKGLVSEEVFSALKSLG